MRESSVEAALRGLVAEAGGLAVKIEPTVRGIPDRLVLMPGGAHHLVELKAPGEKPRPSQVMVHEALARIGHPVVVIDSVDSARSWIDSL